MPLLKRTHWKIALPTMIMGCAIWAGGCVSETDQMLDTIDTSVLSAKTNDLARTMDFIYDDRQFDQRDFEQKVSLGLNRWASYSADVAEQANFDRAAPVEAWLKENDDVDVVNRADDLVFLNTDAQFLQEQFWISEISDRVIKKDAINLFELYRLSADNFKIDADMKQPFNNTISQLHPNLETASATQLAGSVKLFDWVVRNIYLLEELRPTAEEIENQRLNDSDDPGAAGVRVVGQQRFPHQTVMYGRGDYIDRAKVLLMLLRAAKIDATMLSVVDADGEPKPWAVGVAIDDDYYLFDTKLGLPIPGKVPGSIATLSDVRANGDLLSDLDLTIEESLMDDSAYWVQPEQTKVLVAQTYVTPESLTRRMAALESSLVDDSRLTLAAFPSDELKRLPEIEGVEKTLWDVAIKTHRFRKAVGEALPKAVSDDSLSDRLRWYYQEESYIDQFHVYRTNRVRFFKGKFESRDEDLRRNAVESCQVLLYTDDEIDQLATDKNTMAMLGLDDKNPVTFEARLRSVQAQMKLVRRDVGLFLSQCLFDNGNPGTSANWLDGIVGKDDVERWRSGIQYLLGRSYESRKEYDLAIEQYKKEDSNQIHGNLIRARLLKTAVLAAYPEAAQETQKETEAASSETPEAETPEAEPAKETSDEKEAAEPVEETVSDADAAKEAASSEEAE